MHRRCHICSLFIRFCLFMSVQSCVLLYGMDVRSSVGDATIPVPSGAIETFQKMLMMMNQYLPLHISRLSTVEVNERMKIKSENARSLVFFYWIGYFDDGAIVVLGRASVCLDTIHDEFAILLPNDMHECNRCNRWSSQMINSWAMIFHKMIYLIRNAAGCTF